MPFALVVRTFLALSLLTLNSTALRAQTVSVGEAEAQKCEERIASVRRDVLGRYDDALNEIQLALQKAADLEGAVAVRSERERARNEQALANKDLVTEPKALRALQTQTLTRLGDLTTQLVTDTVPKLVELKRSLTVAGKLDEAIAVRTAIERLQNSHLPINRPDPGSLVTAETLLQSYAADRARSDKTYKGQKITVRGVVGGFRQDATDGKLFHVFLTGPGGGWVQCTFAVGDFRFREEQQFNNTILIITPKGNEGASVRIQKGGTAEIRGMCDGFEETVKLSKCDVPR